MEKKILVISGHPAKESLSLSLAKEYVKGAKGAGASVRLINLAQLKFDPILHEGYKLKQKLEEDLEKSARDILWADHLVFVYPTWWGGPPALFKGFFERVFTPGFAFKYESKKRISLIKNKSARIITTTGASKLLSYFLVNATTKHMVKNALFFCGVNPRKATLFGKVNSHMGEKYIQKIFSTVKNLGKNLS